MCSWKAHSAAAVPAAPMTDGITCALATLSGYRRSRQSVRTRTMCLKTSFSSRQGAEKGGVWVGAEGGEWRGLVVALPCSMSPSKTDAVCTPATALTATLPKTSSPEGRIGGKGEGVGVLQAWLSHEELP